MSSQGTGHILICCGRNFSYSFSLLPWKWVVLYSYIHMTARNSIGYWRLLFNLVCNLSSNIMYLCMNNLHDRESMIFDTSLPPCAPKGNQPSFLTNYLSDGTSNVPSGCWLVKYKASFMSQECVQVFLNCGHLERVLCNEPICHCLVCLVVSQAGFVWGWRQGQADSSL